MLLVIRCKLLLEVVNDCCKWFSSFILSRASFISRNDKVDNLKRGSGSRDRYCLPLPVFSWYTCVEKTGLLHCLMACVLSNTLYYI